MTTFTTRHELLDGRAYTKIFAQGDDENPIAEVTENATGFGFTVYMTLEGGREIFETRRWYEDAIGYAFAILNGVFNPIAAR